MTENITFIDRVKAYKELITAIGVAIAAIGAVTSSFISAQPQEAELPPEQIQKIDMAFAQSSEAIALAKANDQRLDERGKDYVPCSIRQFDQIFNELNIEPVCPLVQPN